MVSQNPPAVEKKTAAAAPLADEEKRLIALKEVRNLIAPAPESSSLSPVLQELRQRERKLDEREREIAVREQRLREREAALAARERSEVKQAPSAAAAVAIRVMGQ